MKAKSNTLFKDKLFKLFNDSAYNFIKYLVLKKENIYLFTNK